MVWFTRKNVTRWGLAAIFFSAAMFFAQVASGGASEPEINAKSTLCKIVKKEVSKNCNIPKGFETCPKSNGLMDRSCGTTISSNQLSFRTCARSQALTVDKKYSAKTGATIGTIGDSEIDACARVIWPLSTEAWGGGSDDADDQLQENQELKEAAAPLTTKAKCIAGLEAEEVELTNRIDEISAQREALLAEYNELGERYSEVQDQISELEAGPERDALIADKNAISARRSEISSERRELSRERTDKRTARGKVRTRKSFCK